MTFLSTEGPDPAHVATPEGPLPAPSGSAGSDNRALYLTGVTPLNRAPGAVTLTARTLTVRLSVADLTCGGVISIKQGTAHRLWVVDHVMEGAGDGCMELTLRPQP